MDLAAPSAIGGIVMGGFMLLYFAIMIGLLGLSIYVMILFIRLARKGMQALDIYIRNNENGGQGE